MMKPTKAQATARLRTHLQNEYGDEYVIGSAIRTINYLDSIGALDVLEVKE